MYFNGIGKSVLWLGLLLIALQPISTQSYPAESWERNRSPLFSGWNMERLDEIRDYVIDSTFITGMMIIHDGKVVFEFGNIKENSYIASCRKSVLSMLYGKYVKEGIINLDKSLAEIELKDGGFLSDREKQATIRDLISARSGIFVPAANGGDMSALAPARGSKVPGTFWLYNNWDFNAAGYVFEHETKSNIYDEVERQLVIPLNMQDWDRSLQIKSGDYKMSSIPAYHMWFSTRDMARIGWLMLNKGSWNGQEIISQEWIEESTSEVTTFEEINTIAPGMAQVGGYFAYGYMWWLWKHPDNSMLKGAYTASGAWGQTITVYPALNSVLVFKTKNEYERVKGNPNKIIDAVASAFDRKKQLRFNDLANALSIDDIDQFTIALSQLEPEIHHEVDFQQALNILGYNYLEQKDYYKATKIFQANVKLFPDSWNAYDSLAESYLLGGSLTKAHEYYTRAMELNTGNQIGYNATIKDILHRISYLISEEE